MKAVVMNRFGSSDVFSMKEVPKPQPQEREVCIKVKAAGFNPVDWKIREGWYGGDPEKIIGCDVSGIVDSVGPQESRFCKGDEVYAMAFLKGSNGGYAEYTCVPSECVAKKVDTLDFEASAVVPLAAMTAYRATIASRAFAKGDTVFIAGAGGGVGMFACYFLRSIGIQDIYTIARDKNSANFLQQTLNIPNDHILIYKGLSADNLKKESIKMVGSKLFNGTLDLVGGTMKQLCLELAKISGHFVTVLPEEKFTMPIWGEEALPRAKNLGIHQVAVGAELGSADRKNWQIYTQHLECISEMFNKGTIKKPFFTRIGSFSVKTVQKAHALLESGRVKGKLVMTMP